MRRRKSIAKRGRSRRGERITSRYTTIVVQDRPHKWGPSALLLDSRNHVVNLLNGTKGEHSAADMKRLAAEHWPEARARKRLPLGWQGEPLA
jgi:hypothetical protein